MNQGLKFEIKGLTEFLFLAGIYAFLCIGLLYQMLIGGLALIFKMWILGLLIFCAAIAVVFLLRWFRRSFQPLMICEDRIVIKIHTLNPKDIHRLSVIGYFWPYIAVKVSIASKKRQLYFRFAKESDEGIKALRSWCKRHGVEHGYGPFSIGS